MRRIISPCTSGVVLLLVIGLMNRSDGFNTNNIHPWSIASSAHRSLSNHENHINNVNDDVSSRRKVLERGTAFISFLLLTDQSPANAFENKISNQYDDRPKQRGSQVR